MKASGLPEGVFSMLFDNGVDVGIQLVKHPAIKAVAFTGSYAGGTALMKLAAARPEPIPCYSEMGSVNPVFVLPGALKQRGPAIAAGLQGSFTLGAGQFCTKPGLVLVPQQDGTPGFMKELGEKVAGTPSQTLLTKAIADRYTSAVKGRQATVLAEGAKAEVQPHSRHRAGIAVRRRLQRPDGKPGSGAGDLRPNHRRRRLPGPQAVPGGCRAAGRASDRDSAGGRKRTGGYSDLIDILTRKVGRLILNAYPTGVEVCHAMVHGGPFPATSDGRSTSVGTQAIYRFTRLVCYQSFPDAALPDELKSANPLGIMRMVDGDRNRKPSA